MADWSKPTLTSTYTNYLSETTGRDVDCATQFQSGTATNIPTNTVRWNSGIGRWQLWSGTAWGELASTYNFTGISCTSLNNTGNTTLGDSSADTVTSNAASWTFANATTIAGSLTFSGSMTFSGAVNCNSTLKVSGVDVVVNTSASVIGALGYTPANGIASNGQQVVSANTTLTAASNLGTNILITTGGITVTLPANAPSGRTVNLSNISGSDVTLSYSGTAGSDGPTTLAAGTSVMLISDGGSPSYWREFFASGAFDGSKLFDAGFKDLPQNARTSAYTLALDDRGKHISITTGGVAIPPNSSVAFPVGSTIVVYNDSASTQQITITTDTLRLGGSTSVGARTVAAYGVATLLKVGPTTWVVNGNVS